MNENIPLYFSKGLGKISSMMMYYLIFRLNKCNYLETILRSEQYVACGYVDEDMQTLPQALRSIASHGMSSHFSQQGTQY